MASEVTRAQVSGPHNGAASARRARQYVPNPASPPLAPDDPRALETRQHALRGRPRDPEPRDQISPAHLASPERDLKGLFLRRARMQRQRVHCLRQPIPPQPWQDDVLGRNPPAAAAQPEWPPAPDVICHSQTPPLEEPSGADATKMRSERLAKPGEAGATLNADPRDVPT